MKTRKFKQGFLLLLTIFIVNNAYGSDEHTKKTIHKEYNVEQGHDLYIENRFGSIDIINWEKDLVSIDIIIEVKHGNQEKAKKLLDHITVKINQTGNSIEAVTIFKDGFNKVSGNKNFYVNYNINMPEYLNINIKNKFGSTYIKKVTGIARLDIKHGSLNINEIIKQNEQPMNKITLTHGKADIKKTTWLKISCEHSSFTVDEAIALSIYSRHAKFEIDKSSSLIIDSKHDVYDIGTLKNLIIDSEHSVYKIQKLMNRLELNSRHTNLKALNIPVNFTEIKVQNEHGGINLGIDPSASYKINGEMQHGRIYYPDKANVSRIIKNTEMSVNGIIGNSDNPLSQVIINARHCNVNLK